MKRLAKSLLLTSAIFLLASTAYADEVTDWNLHLLEAVHIAYSDPLTATRSGAIAQAAVFDAVNGIERQYPPIHVEPAADTGASSRAAVVQAAYVTIAKLFPAQLVTLNAKRQASLDRIQHDSNGGGSISAGVAWGQKVADAILEWRSSDGFSAERPPYLGGSNPGQPSRFSPSTSAIVFRSRSTPT